MKQKISPFVFLLFLMACSSERNTFLNRAFHNTTAKYNAYYYANAKIQELEAGIQANHREDFTQVLPVFYRIDSAFIKENKELLKDTREFASKAVDWHRISKWVDPSYFLLGMADYYEAQFDDASNTFKYLNVNSKKKKIRHRSLIQLLRISTDLGNFEDANYIIDYLTKETGISSDNKFHLYKNLAYYYDKRGEINGKLGALDRSLAFTKNKKELSRTNFIIAQLYQREGLNSLAFDYYQKSLRGNPPYERYFFAQLYAQQVADLNRGKDVKRVRSYYDDLYKDTKNKELRDVILYEKAVFELKQGDVEEAERLLIRAAKEDGNNPIQKGYIYSKLADIAFEIRNDFVTSKYFLDSAATNFRPVDPPYEDIMARKEVLDRYVENYLTVSRNDSLLQLSELSREAQERIAQDFIKAEEERLLKMAAEKDQPKATGIFDNLLAFSGRGSGQSFYFENALAIQQGSIDFSRNWGNRPLQDNWRRASQSFQTPTSSQGNVIGQTDSLGAEPENPILSQLPELETLLSKIPSNPEQINQMRLDLEEAYFELAKILFFDLNVPLIAIENLESLITKYPNSVKKPEAYYILYLAQKETGGNADIYAQRLNREFPNSPFTLSINNPEKISGNQAYLESSRGYKEAYELYQNKQYTESRQKIRSTLEQFPLTKNTDRLLLLDIMVTGKIDSKDLYQEKLENFIQTSEDEPLANMARNMLGLLTGPESAEQESGESEPEEQSAETTEEEVPVETEAEEAESPYKDNPNQTHIFVIAMDPEKARESKNLLGDLELFHSQNFASFKLRTGNMNMGRENVIFIISPFSNAEKGITYRDKFMSDFQSNILSDEEKGNCFLISIENFQELNRRKNLDEYRNFYKKAY